MERLCEVAREALGTPMAYVSLIGNDAQHIRATAGFEPRDTPRKGSFCDHTIRGDDVLVVRTPPPIPALPTARS